MIRLAIAIASGDAPPNAFVVWRGFESSIAKARGLGYDGVELALQDASQVEPSHIARLLRDNGVSCPCISTGQMFANLKLFFTSPDAATRREVVKVFKGIIDLAARLGSMVNIGRVRGFVAPDQSPQEARGLFVDVARELAAYALPRHVKLILEPVNHHEINFISSLAQGADLLDEVAMPNFALMPDLFHMNIEDPSITGELERFIKRVAYIHLADSNRRAPGQGHLDFPAIFATLCRCGYDGWAAVEILPHPDADTAARQAMDFLRPLKEAYSLGPN
jgi:sugar phosphate isomerase/epimerase